MAQARPASDQERLPWLDSRVRRRRRDLRPLLVGLFAIAAFMAVGGLAYWFGQRSVGESADDWPAQEAVDTRVTQELPSTIVEPPVDEAPPAPPIPAPAPVPPDARPQPDRGTERRTQAAAKPAATESRTAAKREAPSRSARRATKAAARKPAATPRRRVAPRPRSGYWPTPATAVTLGRVIQIGVFSSPKRADDAWTKTLRRYPQTRGLPRITSAYEARNGRTYYRLQIMTTAPAQSQWLCRKMRSHGRRCTVLGSAK